jgi:hypothetical protein
VVIEESQKVEEGGLPQCTFPATDIHGDLQGPRIPGANVNGLI